MKTFLFSLLFCAQATAAPLPDLRLEKATASGVSSGAFMAVQLQVALSAKLQGAGSVAGGLYGCAEGDSNKAVMRCMMNPKSIVTADFIERAKEEGKQRKIDPTENLKAARLYVFQSDADAVVKKEAADKLAEFFEAFGADVKIERAKTGAHGFPTEASGNPCEKSGAPWILNCKRDVAGEILSQLYPGLTPPSGKEPAGRLLTFEQSRYGSAKAKLLPEGYIYVPAACAAGGCRLHIALHGCQMGSDRLGDQFVKQAGYNRWADANRIVILYPQAATGAQNPNGCWDWFGYTGKDYALKSGKQIQFINKLLESFGI